MTKIDLTKNESEMYKEINYNKLVDLLYKKDYEIQKLKKQNEKMKKKLQSLQKILHLVEVVDKYE